jgi:hypothetical protein
MKTNRTRFNKKRVHKKRNRTVRKQRGGDLDERLITNIEIVRGCNPQFYPPSDDKPRNINKSLQSLGINTETLAITEKPELLKYYGNLLDEYIEDKREIFFDIIDKLVLDDKIPNDEFPKQNIAPTLCCMSLLEKMKAINKMANEKFKEYFNPKNPYLSKKSKKTSTKKSSKSDTLDLPETSYFIIDKPFLEKVKEHQDLQDIKIIEEFLRKYAIDKPEDSSKNYVDDLIRLFNTRGIYPRVDETVLGTMKSKIRSINEDKQKAEIEREKEKQQQEDEKKRVEEFERIKKKRLEELQKAEEERKKQEERTKEEERQKLYRIIEGFTETGGLFGEARKTLQYFSENEKKLIIKRLSPEIGTILQDQDTNLDHLLIDILHQNFKARETYKKGLPKLDTVAKDKHGSSWIVAYSLLPTMENGKKIIGRKMYQHKLNGEVRESLN